MSRIIYAIARSESPFVKRTFLKIFLGLFDINMAEAAQPDPFAYRTFNDFFTRALKPGARPIAIEPEFIVSPVDGTVSQCGELLNESILQAKGQPIRCRSCWPAMRNRSPLIAMAASPAFTSRLTTTTAFTCRMRARR